MTNEQREKLKTLLHQYARGCGILPKRFEIEEFVDELVEAARMEGAIIGNTLAELNHTCSEKP